MVALIFCPQKGVIMKKKLLTIIIALLAVITCAFGLAACSKSNESNKPQWGEEYSVATAYAQAQSLGYTGTLDEFIASISGKDGTNGKDGLGIKEVTFNKDNELVITLTDNTTLNIGKLPPCKHSLGKSVTITGADCYTIGIEYRECSYCGYKDYTFTPSTHLEVIDNAVEPTCTEKGKTEGTHCSLCNRVLVAQTEIPAKGHTWDDNFCTTCKVDFGGTKKLSWQLYNDNGYILTGLNNCTSKQIVIPSTYNGLPVSKISTTAFKDNTQITNISLPDSLLDIAAADFDGCTNLQYNVYKNVKYLGNATNPYLALIEPTELPITALNIHKDTKIIANTPLGGILKNVYFEGNLATWCTIKGANNVLSSTRTLYINNQALAGVLTIPNTVTYIGDHAFYDCNALTSVNIPDSVTKICESAFSGCSVTSATIGNGVTSMGGQVFYGCSSLESVTLGNSLTEISYAAFAFCNNLTDITISDSVTVIAATAFSHCYKLENIIYKGTKEQWAAIRKNFQWDIETGDFIITCTDGKLDKSGNEI